jgi:predicted DNA-binding transcriptional regulator YafY
VRTTDFRHIRTLAVERILELSPTEDHFLYPADFDPEQKLAGAFDIVFDDPVYARIWISPDQARYVLERRIPGLESRTENADGSLVLEIETSGWWDLKQWILGFGAEAEVLDPPELREEMRAELERACGRYAR